MIAVASSQFFSEENNQFCHGIIQLLSGYLWCCDESRVQESVTVPSPRGVSSAVRTRVFLYVSNERSYEVVMETGFILSAFTVWRDKFVVSDVWKVGRGDIKNFKKSTKT